VMVAEEGRRFSRGFTAAAVAIVATAGLPLMAARFEIIPTYKNEPVSDTRVCFSRAQRDGSVVERMTSGPEVRCVPGDKLLTIPQGTWHFYVASDNPPLIATHPYKIITPRDSQESDPVNQIRARLLPAATLDVTDVATPEGVALFIYVSHDGIEASPPALLPVSPGTRKLLVPAGMPLVPLKIRGNVILDVGDEVSVSAGQTARATFPSGSSVTAVVPYRVRESDHANDLPALQLLQRGGAKAATLSLHPNRTRGLFVIRVLPRGTFDVQIESDRWTGNGVSLQRVEGQTGILIGADLVINPAKEKISIQWSVDPALLEGRFDDDCDGSVAARRETVSTLRLLSCPDSMPERPPLARFCQALRTLTLPEEPSGTISWPTPVGRFVWLELRRAGLSVVQRLDLREGETTVAAIQLVPARLSGRVTLGGAPLRATVNCVSTEVISNEATGDYRCWTNAKAPFVTFTVNPCDGSPPYTHIAAITGTDQEIDIDIRENSLAVDVMDARTGQPIENAYVTLWHDPPTEPSDEQPVRLGATGADGRITKHRVQSAEDVTICAVRAEYERQCASGLTIEKNERTSASITLTRTPGFAGTITGAPLIVDGTIAVVRNGFELDKVRVNPDGSFRLNSAPPADGHLILTSASLPLTVLAIESRTDTRMTLRLPLLIPRTFSVSTADAAPVTLVLGQVLVPINVFSRHQQLHRQQHYVTPSRPLLVRNVDASSGVVVVLGRTADLNVDPFVNPALYGAMPKHVLTSADHIAFD
jgi:hypothetical protein